MASDQVVVTLTPVYSPDTLPFRSLTFCSNNDTVPIGRASKSETKNLVPEHDNGWFESRVMSREHAVISVNLQDKSVFIRDHGSLHGTLLNDAKIPAKKNVAVKSGDVLMFGCEISRGTQTFRPIAVRLDCNWHEAPVAPAQTKSNTNTFSVPDEEDDEVVEVVPAKDISLPQRASQWSSDSSDAGHGSDMSRPLDLTSPATSPAMHTSQLPKPQSIVVEDSRDYDDQQMGVLVDSDDEDEDEYGSELDEYNMMDDGISVHSLLSTNSFIEGIEAASARHLQDFATGVIILNENGHKGPSSEAVTTRPAENANEAPKINPPQTTEDNSQLPSQVNLNNKDKGKRPISAVGSQSSTNQEPAWSGAPEESSPQLPTLTSPFSPSVPASQSSNAISPAIQAWANSNRLSSDTTAQDATNLTCSVGSNNANESFPFGPHRSSGYLRYAADRTSGSGRPAWLSADSSNADCEAKNKTEPPVAYLPSRGSLSNIDKIAPGSKSPSVNKLKRKAPVGFAAEDWEYVPLKESQDSITDAQPRPDLKNLEVSQASAANTQLVAQSIPARQRKRVKTTQISSWMKYAAIAAVGAAVGSIGTIAGLSSLPTDYFI